MKIMDSYTEIFKNAKTILTIFAHPDDQEIVCGGTIARLVSDGKAAVSVVMTPGGKGMGDRTDIDEKSFGEMRKVEQKEAGNILGVNETIFLDIPDGEVEADMATIEKLVKIIRSIRPDVVITHNPHDFYIHFFDKSTWVNHRDHRKTGEVVFDAVYPYSRDNGFFPEQIANGLSGHTLTTILTADSYLSPDVLYFEVTDFRDKKLSTLRKHKSSFDDATAKGFVEENMIGEKYYEPLGLCIAG